MWFNKIMIPLLKSPLHFFISKNTMLMTFKGKMSGKKYQVPVNYLKVGDRLLTTSFRARKWWRNLRGGMDVNVILEGKSRGAIAELVEDPEKVGKLLGEYFRAAPKMAMYFNVKLDGNGIPNASDIQRQARDRVVVVTQLTA